MLLTQGVCPWCNKSNSKSSITIKLLICLNALFSVPPRLSPTVTKCVETKAFYLIQESSDAKIGLKLMKNENRARSEEVK